MDRRTRSALSLADELAALDCSPSFVVDWAMEDSRSGSSPTSSRRVRNIARPLKRSVRGSKPRSAPRARTMSTASYACRARSTPERQEAQAGRRETQARLLHPTWQRYAWRDLEELAAHLEDEPLEHAPSFSGNGPAPGPADPADLDLPDVPPEPLDDASLEAMRAEPSRRLRPQPLRRRPVAPGSRLGIACSPRGLGSCGHMAAPYRGSWRPEGLPARLHRTDLGPSLCRAGGRQGGRSCRRRPVRPQP